jgi:methyl-accepting chemotaxis protein
MAQPGMGMGMFGGGAMASLSGQYGRLLNMPAVQKELELVDDQKTKIGEANQTMRESMQEVFSGMQPPSPDMTPEERQKSMDEIQKKMQPVQEKYQKAVEGILLPNQAKRLKEIALQVAGTSALSDKKVQDDLKLSAEQATKIKTINEDMGKKIQAMFAEANGDFQSLRPKMQELRQDTEKQITGVLTDEQKASLEKMKGQKLEIPASELGGRGFRGGPGGPGGPGGGN